MHDPAAPADAPAEPADRSAAEPAPDAGPGDSPRHDPAGAAGQTSPIGEVLPAVVRSVDDRGADLDLGAGADLPGRVDLQDLAWADRASARPGDRLSVLVSGLAAGGAAYRCSAAEADALSVWDAVQSLAESGDVIPTRVIAAVRGGASVDVLGMRGFLPQSQVDVRPVDDLSEIVGETVAVKILDMDPRKGQPVVSRRAVLEEENLQRAKEVLAGMEVGRRVAGKVVRLAQFGAFVDIGGVDALLRTADISWSHVYRPEDRLAEGDELEAVLTHVDAAKGKAAISVKDLVPDPWLSVADRYVPGRRVSGVVVRLTQFGAFVELEEGVDGLIHTSELAWGAARNARPADYVNVGDTVEVEVVEVEADRRRLGISRKRTLPDPLGAFSEAHQPGDLLQGTVRNVADFGIFVELTPEIEGLVHVSEVAWDVQNPDLGAYEPGQALEVKLLSIDPEARRVALGIKQLQGDPWEAGTKDLVRGATLKGVVTRIADFGAFVEIAPGVEGLVHISELSTGHVRRVGDEVDRGDTIEVYVLGVDRRKRKVALSVKALTEPPGADIEVDPSLLDGDASTNLGDLLRGRAQAAEE